MWAARKEQLQRARGRSGEAAPPLEPGLWAGSKGDPGTGLRVWWATAVTSGT